MLAPKRCLLYTSYDAVQIGFGDIKAKNVNKPMAGHFAKAGVEPVRFLSLIHI